MFVPSLSWQNHRFLYMNGSKMAFFAGNCSIGLEARRREITILKHECWIIITAVC
jgi:hypothetical protein